MTTATSDPTGSKYMTRKQTAAYLNMSAAWLAQAGRQQGPPFHKFGNQTRYNIDDVNNWARQQVRR